MARKISARGDFESLFDDELENIHTPIDTIDSIEDVSKDSDVETKESKSYPSDNSIAPSNKFGLNVSEELETTKLIPRTYKLPKETVDQLESLIYKSKNSKNKLPGTKGFLSDFLDNAIWQHFLQLGLITEEEAEKHLKDYKNYPLSIENFKSQLKH